MKEAPRSPQMVCFGVFEVDLGTGELRRRGLKIKIQEQPFEILAMLLARPGELVTREELRQKLWPADTFVDFEHGLNAAINKLREALGDSADNPRFVETLHRRGYRFVYPVDVRAHGVRPSETALAEEGTRRVPLPTRAAVGIAALVLAIALVALLALTVGGLRERLLDWVTLPPPELKERRLTANPTENGLNEGAISPDGKYLAYSDRTGMHLKLIQTGEVLNIPQPEGPAPDPGGWWTTGWFPDSTKFIAAGFGGGAGPRPTAWVISVMGGPPRKLRDEASPWAVSPDGTLIAFGTGPGFVRYREVWLMGAQGEEPRRFVSGSEDEGFFWGAWSPDGRRVAYGRFHRTPDKLECSIESRDLTGGQPTVILSDPRLCSPSDFLWSPGGRLFFIMSEPEPNQGYNNLWEIRLDTRTGEPLSKPRRITNWAEVVLVHVSATRDGKQLAIAKSSYQADVYVAALEAEGRSLKNARRLTLEESKDYPGQWMPDSKSVLFQSDRNGMWGIYKQGLDQAAAQPVVTGPDYKKKPVMSPDGAWILYLSRASPESSAATPVRIMRVPAWGGAPQLVLEGHGIDDLACARSPTALCVFSEWTPDQGQLIFSAFDPVNGRGEELTRVNPRKLVDYYHHSWDLSRDGSRLAFTQYDKREGRIRILPLAGGNAREVNVKSWYGLLGLFWATDGKGLFVGSETHAGSSLLHVDLDGRTNVLWQQRATVFWHPSDLLGTWVTWGVPSPDGRHLAPVGYTGDSNVWMLENF